MAPERNALRVAVAVLLLAMQASAANEVNLTIESLSGFCLRQNTTYACDGEYLILKGTEDAMVDVIPEPLYTPTGGDRAQIRDVIRNLPDICVNLLPFAVFFLLLAYAFASFLFYLIRGGKP